MENALQARKQAAHPGLMMVSMLLGAFVGMFSETSLNIALPKLMTAPVLLLNGLRPAKSLFSH